MDFLKNTIDFFNSYPLWAKLLALTGLLVAIGTLFFVPRNVAEQKKVEDKPDNDSKTSQNRQSRVYLKIQRVRLFPSNRNTEIQVFAFVNETKFKYPSISGVEWLKVGPSMSPGIFDVPKSDIYEVRFEMKTRNSGSPNFVSEQVLRVSKLPYSDEYKLHQVNNRSRAASVSAAIDFSIEEGQ